MFIKEGTSITQYIWRWGDNSSDTTVVGYKASQNVAHTYSFPGLYNISVRASQDGEDFDAQRSILIIGNIHNYDIWKFLFLF